MSLQSGAVLMLWQKVEGVWIPLYFRGCRPRGHVQASRGRDQLTDLHCVSLVGDSRVAHGEGGLASLFPKLDAGFLCFTSFSECVFALSEF